MKEKNTIFNLIPKAQRTSLTEDIIHFFQSERGEQIGIIAAEEVLDFFEDRIAPHVYNHAVSEAKKFFIERSDDVALDFELLKREV